MNKKRSFFVSWHVLGLCVIVWSCIFLALAALCKRTQTESRCRNLSVEEMGSIFGSACGDCNGVKNIIEWECKADDSLGCAHECSSVWIGTGNSRNICVGDEDPAKNTGLCEKLSDDIICYRSYTCKGGVSQYNMKCSPISGNCIAGNVWCTECTDCEEDGPIHSPGKLPTYECKAPPNPS